MLRAYRALLRLLPGDFRREYGDEMSRVVEEHWRAARPELGALGATRFWIRQGLAVLRVAATSRTRPRTEHPHPIRRPPRPANRRSRPMQSWEDIIRMKIRRMEDLYQDFRASVRSLALRPGFTLVTVMTLALGIGASTAIFSAVYAVMMRELPYGEADRIVAVFHENTETGARGSGLSAANARDLMEASEQLTAVAVADPYSLDLQVDGRAESLRAWAVSEGFFEAVQGLAYLGRTFTLDEYAGGENVVMLGHRSWRDRFGGDFGLLGATLTLDGAPATVVGILPPEFKLPDEAELWIPRSAEPHDDNARAADYLMGVARLAPGSTLERAQAEVEQIAAGLGEAYPRTNATTSFRLVPLREHLFGDIRTPLLVLLGAVGFVLLIACANVAGLMLARGAERQREYALRSALGASTGRLMRHVTIDSLILASLGCGLGVGLTYAGIWMIRGLGPDHLPRIDEIAVDGTVLAFAVVVAAISAFLSGLAPALQFSRPDLRDTLNDGGRSATTARRGLNLRNGIVVAEITAAMILLVGAGLLSRSFGLLMDRDLGFDPSHRLAIQVFAYGYSEERGQTQAQFVDRALEEIAAIPGVRDVALTTNLPAATDGTLAAIDIDLPFAIEDRPPLEEGHEPEALVSMSSEGFFEVMGIRLLSGRTFAASDDAQSPDVIVVNEAFVRTHFDARHADALGATVAIGFGPRSPREIVGVVADVRRSGHESEPRPEIFFPLRQMGSGSLTFVLRTDIDPALVTAAAKEAVWRANPEQSVWGAATVETLLADWLKERSFNLWLLGSFAIIALALAGVGIYGLISFSVQRRVAEMGIRRALGGRSRSIVGMVLREAQMLAAVGVALGVAGALAMTRFIQGMLFGVEATDPVTFLVLALAVLAVAAIAALIPALRAMRIDPVVALRSL